jgi:scyllo-inositol 2-dehydrogenase (NADP+)
MRALILPIVALALAGQPISARQAPVRLAIAGLSHDHVRGVFSRGAGRDVVVVGIYEPDHALATRYAHEFGIDPSLLYTDLGTMLDQVKPEAVAAFGSIFDHLAVVQAAAPRGVHVMVEKPLAVSVEHARLMAALARQHHIHLLTNYETTWYASTSAIASLVGQGRIGPIRKIVVHDGHQGPKEIGVSDDFFRWLTDPVLNGGGALIDFGCYGADLITGLMKGEAPLTVTAVTQQIKPDIYPRVDDEATIIVTYPQAQGIIQASWNWPVGRKDIEVYGKTGYVFAPDGRHLRQRLAAQAPEQAEELPPRAAPEDAPFSYLAAVVRGGVTVADTDLSSLATNLTVVAILDAARESARTGKTVKVQEVP